MFYRSLLLLVMIATQPVVITIASINSTTPIQTKSKGDKVDSVSDIQSLKSDIHKRAETIGRWNNASIAFVVLAFVAAGGLAVTSIVLKGKNDALDSAREQLSSLNEKQYEADSKAKDVEISATQQKAAEAEARAAEAKLELARLKTPRTLSPEQQRVIIDAVKGFPGTPFDFFVNSDEESVNLTDTLENCLISAGWKRADLDPSVTVRMDRGGDKKPFALWVGTGVAVEISQSRVDLLKATDALVGVLKKEGLGAKGFAAASGVTPNAIHIKIGKKP